MILFYLKQYYFHTSYSKAFLGGKKCTENGGKRFQLFLISKNGIYCQTFDKKVFFTQKLGQKGRENITTFLNLYEWHQSNPSGPLINSRTFLNDPVLTPLIIRSFLPKKGVQKRARKDFNFFKLL